MDYTYGLGFKWAISLICRLIIFIYIANSLYKNNIKDFNWWFFVFGMSLVMDF